MLRSSSPVSSTHREHDHASRREAASLRVAFFATLAILGVEVGGGLLSHSLALLADAAHMATDSAAAALAWYAARLAVRAADKRRTFGYGRASVLAALLNAGALFAVVVFIGVAAIRRIAVPVPIGSHTMLATAAFALVANVVVSWYLARNNTSSLNVRGVIVHLIGDAAISGAVILAAIVIAVWGWNIVDPIISILASGVVAFSAWSLVREAIDVLMESAPRHLDITLLRERVRTCDACILDVHDVHVWSVSDRRTAASLHVRIAESNLLDAPKVIVRIKQLLHDDFSVTHATIEIECADCASDCE